MNTIDTLKVKIFADGADLAGMLDMASKPLVKGLTTNPTLMCKAGIKNYKSFAAEVLSEIKTKPISFEVFSDDFGEMERQALEIASWGENVYVKIPIMNTKREYSLPLIEKLSRQKVKLNVTALMNLEQVHSVVESIDNSTLSYVSVFAGRVADTGRDPVPLMSAAVELLKKNPNAELIWASPRELWNIFQADQVGCHIITVSNDILKKMNVVDKNLEDFSLETVKMFYDDACRAGYEI
jgi:transaldolase